ncbi:MAG: fibrinogen-like YCDxxxxGGGW domain-containing protein [Myxococcota bacterium]
MRSLSFLLLAALTSACATSDEPAGTVMDDDGASLQLSVDDSETRLILFVANTADVDELDFDVRLDSRAANNIVDQRPFDTIAELDAVSYVGDSALTKLRDYATANPVDVFGIQEGSLLAEAILDLANDASQNELDVDVALDSRAAANIVNGRVGGDFYSLGQLDEVSYVASSAFGKLALYVDADGDQIPVLHDCDDNDSSLTGLGDSATCAAESCAQILDAHPTPEDGTYTLQDDAGNTFDVECDMTTDGGGWTIITGALIDDQDWVDFSIESGTPSTNAGGAWTSTAGEFLLVPENADNAAGTFSCVGVAVRATTTLPFTFTEWEGSFTADETDSSHHADDAITDAVWGESRDECGGYFKFGTDQDDSKTGGEWGWNWAPETWDFGTDTVSETDVIRWETMDSFAAEGVLVKDVEIRVR